MLERYVTTGLPQPQNVPMEFVGDRERLASFLALQDAPTLAQVLLELAEDHTPVYARLERLRLRDDLAALSEQFTRQLQRWVDDRESAGGLFCMTEAPIARGVL